MRQAQSKWGGRRKRREEDAIDMRERRHEYFPKTFAWRGEEHHVAVVEKCWTEDDRHCFRVRTHRGVTVDVVQNVRRNMWSAREA
jgi:hypothetical protein